ncbi:MAG TPA: hypothetical protein VMW32_00045 [Bacteroidales bacterium]|nr:hypothetical protein [Bacteroidales bacterium]
MSLEISCGYLHTIQRMADDIWADPMKNTDMIADVISLKAILENQSVRFEEIERAKNNELRVEWLTKCSITPTECSDDCDITGEDADPLCKDYEIGCLFESSFKVPLRHYRDRTIEMQESIAFNKLMHMKALDERLVIYAGAGVLANLGTNLYTSGVGNVSGTTTYIAAQYWDDSIWGYFDQVRRLNKLGNTYMITGNNLYQLLFNRTLEACDADGCGNYKKLQQFKIYQDPENVETYAPGETFMIHKTSVAFLNKAWNKINPINAEVKAGQYWEWSEESKNLPGVYYDFIMKETCEGDEFYQAYKIKVSGLLAVNPFPCDEDNTGILMFECGTE